MFFTYKKIWYNKMGTNECENCKAQYSIDCPTTDLKETVEKFREDYIAKYNDTEETLKKYCNDYRNKLDELKPVIDSVCDDWVTKFDLLSKYLKRH